MRFHVTFALLATLIFAVAPYTASAITPLNASKVVLVDPATGNPYAASSGTNSNASVGPTGSAAPASATQPGYVNGSGNLVPVTSTAGLPVNIVGGGSSANASVGTNNTTAPTSTTQAGYVNGSGNLVPVTSSAGLPISVAGTLPVSNSANATLGTKPYFNSAVSNSALVVKSTAGNLYSFKVYNPGATDTYLQVFDSSAAVTVGTTAPTNSYHIYPNGSEDIVFAGEAKAGFANGIQIAATTTVNGAVAPATPIIVNMQYF